MCFAGTLTNKSASALLTSRWKDGSSSCKLLECVKSDCWFSRVAFALCLCPAFSYIPTMNDIIGDLKAAYLKVRLVVG